MRIVVTGARGRIGRAVIPYLAARHEVVGIDARASLRGRVLRADLSRRSGRLARAVGWRRSRWQRAFDGADAVLHLAGVASPTSTWARARASNVDATWNVLEEAAALCIPRVVFASSLWPVRGVLEEWGKAGLPEDPGVLRPTCPYGFSKGVGELAGRMFVETGQLRTFVAVRIGIFHRKTPKADPFGVHVRPHELNEVLSLSLEGDLEGFHLRYAIGAGSASDPSVTVSSVRQPAQVTDAVNESVGGPSPRALVS
jgi:nucleoside-diphosphate-sugar epimerase